MLRTADALQDADVGLLFYAGHGMRVRGQNYLVPIDATLTKETDLIFQAVDLGNVLKLLDDRPRTSLVFLTPAGTTRSPATWRGAWVGHARRRSASGWRRSTAASAR